MHASTFFGCHHTQQPHDAITQPSGVFPRPDNISRTFGGGRNLRPGQPLESDEQQAARQARVGAALARYRQQQGLVVDPEVEAAAQRAFDEGSALFKEGRLEGALERFTEAAAAMNVRTKLGAQVWRCLNQPPDRFLQLCVFMPLAGAVAAGHHARLAGS